MDSSKITSFPIMSKLIITKFLDPKEDFLSDSDYDVFDLVLSINDIVGHKHKILQDSMVQGDAFHLVESGLVNFCFL